MPSGYAYQDAFSDTPGNLPACGVKCHQTPLASLAARSRMSLTIFVSCFRKMTTSEIRTTINYPIPQRSKERKALAQILQCISNIYLRTLFKPKKLY